MKRGATKEEIIRATQRLIARDGIRAVRVDEIAATLGISKRTLYELFADKTELITACLDFMRHDNQRRVAMGCRRRTSHPLQRILRLASEYIDGLYTVNRSFLEDIRRKAAFSDSYDEHRTFWIETFVRLLTACRDANLLLPEIDPALFADRTLATLFDLRLSGMPEEELRSFFRMLLRGAATREGIELLDRKR